MALALTHGIPRRRVDEVIELAGLAAWPSKRAGAFSLGMGQRLGIAAALLGDPQTVMLDEPVNGLDPEGVLWIRNLLTGLAAEGRTVFVSSHLMSEMALVADHLIIVGRGRLLADTTVEDLSARPAATRCRSPTQDPARLRDVLAGPGVDVTGRTGSEELQVTGLTAREIGLKAAEHGIALFELTAQDGLPGGGVHGPDQGCRRVPRLHDRHRDLGRPHEHPHRNRRANPVPPARPVYRVTGRRVLSSEWAKLWSLRSTWITLGLGLLFLVAFGADRLEPLQVGDRLRQPWTATSPIRRP